MARTWLGWLVRWVLCVAGVAWIAGSSATGQSTSPGWPGDFEGDTDLWESQQVWEFGTPSGAGPGGAYGGRRCAGTILAGNYPPNLAGALLLSPEVLVPTAELEPQLRFAHWLECQPVSDWVAVEITEVGSGRRTELARYTRTTRGWTEAVFDLRPFAGKRVRFGFRLVSDATVQAPGWYVDDIRVETPPRYSLNPGVVETFENGWNGWAAERGVWDVRTPANWPSLDPPFKVVISGRQCVGTMLGGRYLSGCGRFAVGKPPVSGARGERASPAEVLAMVLDRGGC